MTQTTEQTVRSAIHAARQSAGKPWEHDAYRAAQMALQAKLDASKSDEPEAKKIATICAWYGVSYVDGVWIVD